ncbi:unnamed protein product, partial [Didymodactylos carnosus]
MTIPRTEDEDENIRLILDLTERRDELKAQLAKLEARLNFKAPPPSLN